MYKFIITTIIIILMLSLNPAAQAADLPIDIGAIGQGEGYGNAVTANSNIDIFTDTSQEVTEYMLEQLRLARERNAGSLFNETSSGQPADADEHLAGQAEEYMLFSQPADHGNINMPPEAAPMPLWIIILIFVICAAGGFVLARVLAKRKRKKADVH